MVSSAISSMFQGTVTAGTTSVKQTSSKTSDTDFMAIMSMTASYNSYDMNDAQTLGNDSTGTGLDSIGSVSQSSDISGRDTVTSKTTDVKDSATSKLDDVRNDNRTDDVDRADVKEAVDDGVDKLKDEIKDTLGVSDEELEDAMAVLGMTDADLFDAQKLTDLVVSLSGSDSSLEFLTDADAVDSLNKILDAMNSVTENLSEELNIAKEAVIDTVNVFETVEPLDDSVAVAYSEEPGDRADIGQNDSEETVYEPDTLEDVLSQKIQVKTEQPQTGSGNADTNSQSHMSDQLSDGIEQITSDMSQSIQQAFDDVVNEVSEVNPVDVARQVIEQVKVTTGQQLQSIEVMLNPENLGKVNVMVTAREGNVTAHLTAQNEQVRAALENQVIALKEHFNNQGIKVEAVEITVQSHAFESQQNLEDNESNQAQEERKSSRRIDLSSLEDLTDEDMTIDEIRARDAIVNGDSSVEYSA